VRRGPFLSNQSQLKRAATVAHFSHRHPGEKGASTEAPEVALGNDAAKLASLFGISRNRLVGFEVPIAFDGEAAGGIDSEGAAAQHTTISDNPNPFGAKKLVFR
jgi:hypothetical protein